jgi:hypothetical protein
MTSAVSPLTSRYPHLGMATFTITPPNQKENACTKVMIFFKTKIGQAVASTIAV